MYLVISEKPSVAQTIAKVLGAYQTEDGYLAGRNCIVSWCLGHLAEYAMPEAYEAAYGKWRFDDLPLIPGEWKLEVAQEKKEQFMVLKKLLTRDNLDYVVNACDAGREGELIFKRVYDLAKSRIPVKRLWISSMEDKAIRDGFTHLKSGAAYKNLADASVCRAQADWLIGINATRAYTTTYSHRLVIGRVQTPTLAMLVRRGSEIADFQKEQYFIVHLLAGGIDALSGHISEREEAERIADDCRGKEARVISVRKENKAVAAPKLYDLTTLQREANRMFGFTAKQTLELAQSLYEKKLLTYPRTDSQYLTEDMEETVIRIADSLPEVLPYLGSMEIPYDWKKVMDNRKVTDHHAIIPTVEIAKIDMTKLTGEEQKILLMATNRLLCAAAPKHQYLSVKAELQSGGYRFTASGKSVIEIGWKVLEENLKQRLRAEDETGDHAEDAQEEKSLPDLVEGQTFVGVETKVTQHWTKPPAPYTEDSLLAAMEQAGKKEMEEGVERKGLGTPATRASIIEKLVSSGYAVRKKKQILATEAGAEMIALLPSYLTSAQMTAEWENRLLAMERGEETIDAFMGDIVHLLDQMIAECREVPVEKTQRFSVEKSSHREIGKCPVCKGPVYEGKSNFYCGKRDCSFTLWKENRYLSSMKKSVSRKMAEELLSKGRCHEKNFYSARTGKTFEADLILDVFPDGKASFRMEFPGQKSRKKKK